jgi:hypothetical protein
MALSFWDVGVASRLVIEKRARAQALKEPFASMR